MIRYYEDCSSLKKVRGKKVWGWGISVYFLINS